MCLLTWALGSAFSLEQPKSSTMEFLASWQFVIDFFKQRGDCLKAHFLNMGSFLAPSKKPTVLYTVFNMEPFTQLPTPATQRRRRGRAPVTRQRPGSCDKRNAPNKKKRFGPEVCGSKVYGRSWQTPLHWGCGVERQPSLHS